MNTGCMNTGCVGQLELVSAIGAVVTGKFPLVCGRLPQKHIHKNVCLGCAHVYAYGSEGVNNGWMVEICHGTEQINEYYIAQLFMRYS